MAPMSMSATTAVMNSLSAAIKHTPRDTAPIEERYHILLNALHNAFYSRDKHKKAFLQNDMKNIVK